MNSALYKELHAPWRLFCPWFVCWLVYLLCVSAGLVKTLWMNIHEIIEDIGLDETVGSDFDVDVDSDLGIVFHFV